MDELSGGQKQLLALASVMVLQPRLLILDEPTSQLDPIAAADFLQTVGRLNRELGITVLLTEHRLEEALPLATHAAVLDGGHLLCAGAPEAVCRSLRGRGHDMFLAMPAAVRIWAGVDSGAPRLSEKSEPLGGLSFPPCLNKSPAYDFIFNLFTFFCRNMIQLPVCFRNKFNEILIC